MREAGMTTSVINFMMAMTTCEKGGQREQALSLLHNMRPLQASVVRLPGEEGEKSASVGQTQALALLQQMREAGMTTSFGSAISACEEAGQ